jgi:hypothetical protein
MLRLKSSVLKKRFCISLFIFLGVAGCIDTEEDESSNNSGDDHSEVGGNNGGRAYLTGAVTLCSGECPISACGEITEYPDDPEMYVSCETIYDAPLDENSDYCIDGHTGNYCIQTEDNGAEPVRALIQCLDGVPEIEVCSGTCGTKLVNNNGVITRTTTCN